MKHSLINLARHFSPSFALAVITASVAWTAHAGQRYQPNAAGDEVTDGQTGLIWRRCSEGQSWNGSSCSGSVKYLTWDAALAHAQSQTSASGLAWRLPNVKELKSLAKVESSMPAIETSAFPNTPSTSFWSSTPFVGYVGAAWIVRFDRGMVGNDDCGYENAIRLVRSAP